MFRTALMALDLSPAEEALVDCMADLARWGVQRVIVVHVLRVGYAQGPGYRAEEETTQWLERAVAPLRAAGLEVECSARLAGVPADEILLAAAEAGADLIVVGSRSHNLAHRVFLGSVARELVHKTPRPLLLVRVEPDAEATAARCRLVCRDTLRHVMLATDLSKHAGAAERAAVALATHAPRVDCLSVVTPAAVDATPALPLMTRAALDALVQRIAAAGASSEALVTEAEDAGAEITRLAEARDVSLVVAGKHGQHWAQDVIIGSTASRLCETAGRPVLMVPLVAGSGTDKAADEDAAGAAKGSSTRRATASPRIAGEPNARQP